MRLPRAGKPDSLYFYRITEKKRRVYLHREVYKSVFGYIPKGHVIHHIDGNRSNNDPRNLRCMTASDHVLLHKRLGNLHAPFDDPSANR